MKWVPDKTGRFPERPYYERDELDYECESLVTSFLQAQQSSVSYPISTNDLTILLEKSTSDLDLYADLSAEGDEVEGVTDFIANNKPRVRISGHLSHQSNVDNRLRTTVTHELGHVKFHAFLWPHNQIPLLAVTSDGRSPRCKRETILNAKIVDWMEWQAGYASGAFLIPITTLRQIVRDMLGSSNLTQPSITSPVGLQLIRKVQTTFQVPSEAARVRLCQLRLLSNQSSTTPSLFEH